jgi:hypothetical protein
MGVDVGSLVGRCVVCVEILVLQAINPISKMLATIEKDFLTILY